MPDAFESHDVGMVLFSRAHRPPRTGRLGQPRPPKDRGSHRAARSRLSPGNEPAGQFVSRQLRQGLTGPSPRRHRQCVHQRDRLGTPPASSRHSSTRPFVRVSRPPRASARWEKSDIQSGAYHSSRGHHQKDRPNTFKGRLCPSEAPPSPCGSRRPRTAVIRAAAARTADW